VPPSITAWVAHGYTVDQLSMVTPTRGWMRLGRVGPTVSVIHSTLLQTTNGGRTWTALRW
jgi:hypothetical protein